MKAKTKTSILLTAAAGLVAGTLFFTQTGVTKNALAVPKPIAGKKVAAKKSDRVIQIALLLDTSGSMDGLLDQARTQMWRVVTELAKAHADGERPRLEIAIYEYGNDGLPAAEGYLRMVIPFTGDLDAVSEELFALTTNGGEEWAGRAIHAATGGLTWSERPEDLKLIFIAGNEPFTQGDLNVHEAIAGAKAKGIRVNTIYCGSVDSDEAIGWRDGAKIARGEFVTIDHNQKVVYIASPYDDEIASLGVELNGTYVAYGHHGAAASARQAVQDKNAAENEGSLVFRSVAKSSAMYDNSSWDLVDAVADGTVSLDTMADDELPAELRGKSKAERVKIIAVSAAKRAKLQARIAELNEKREAFVAAKRKEMGEGGASSLDKAMIDLVRAQGTEAGYTFE